MLNQDIKQLVESIMRDMYTPSEKLDDTVTTDEIIENILKASNLVERDDIREHYLNKYLEELGLKSEPLPKTQDRIWYLAKK